MATDNSAEPGNNYGCLEERPNPAWFMFRPSTTGLLTIKVASGHDAGFAVWGPYRYWRGAKDACGQLPEPYACMYEYPKTDGRIRPGIPYTESMQVEGGYTQYYILVLTNPANVDQTVTLEFSGDAQLHCPSPPPMLPWPMPPPAPPPPKPTPPPPVMGPCVFWCNTYVCHLEQCLGCSQPICPKSSWERSQVGQCDAWCTADEKNINEASCINEGCRGCPHCKAPDGTAIGVPPSPPPFPPMPLSPTPPPFPPATCLWWCASPFTCTLASCSTCDECFEGGLEGA